ncbi:TorD/DmsD family molecular chaperone [Shewanella sp. 1180_01]|uniref:TorD/DmsD family molecular chaperone n=1 Tax=Shewanella sp. 1180_01 TaxID=2604451 RepID=UPI0040647E96
MKKINLETLNELKAISNILHSVLMLYPEAELLNQFKKQNIVKEWPRLTNSKKESQALDELSRFLTQWNDKNDELIKLKLDYGMVFYGPNTPKATPWGSTYLSPSQLLNDSSTIELKQFYVQHGINIKTEVNEPIDHIGLFMAVLSFLLEKIIENPDIDDYKLVFNELLEVHLLPWGKRCLQLASERSSSDYYKGFSGLGLEFFEYLINAFNLQIKIRSIYR